MAGGFNQVILLGRLGSDPEQRFTQGGTETTSFGLATSRRVKNREGEFEEVTSWHRIKGFGAQAKVLNERAKKGELLFVEGRLDYWKAESARGGELSIAEVIIEHFEFVGGGGRREGAEGPAGGERGAQPARGASRGASSPRGGSRPPAPARGAERGELRPVTAHDPFPDDDIPF
jgi:single-strand DNA-binding protein